MPKTNSRNNPAEREAYIITGPTSGIGRATAFEVTRYGTVVLVGRDREKLDELQKAIALAAGTRCGLSATCLISQVCDARQWRSLNFTSQLPAW